MIRFFQSVGPFYWPFFSNLWQTLVKVSTKSTFAEQSIRSSTQKWTQKSRWISDRFQHACSKRPNNWITRDGNWILDYPNCSGQIPAENCRQKPKSDFSSHSTKVNLFGYWYSDDFVQFGFFRTLPKEFFRKKTTNKHEITLCDYRRPTKNKKIAATFNW